MKLNREWLSKNKGVLLAAILCICAFAIGRTSKSDKSDLLSEQEKRGDSLRTALRFEKQKGIMEAVHRSNLERAYLKEMKKRDSTHLVDKKTIRDYARIIGKQQTPHELEAEMDSIFRATLNGR